MPLATGRPCWVVQASEHLHEGRQEEVNGGQALPTCLDIHVSFPPPSACVCTHPTPPVQIDPRTGIKMRKKIQSGGGFATAAACGGGGGPGELRMPATTSSDQGSQGELGGWGKSLQVA